MHYILFSGHTSPLSNFYLADFEKDGHKFCCSEQAYMYEKAKFFNDNEIAARILHSVVYAGDAKKLGKMVANFDERAWSKVKARKMADIVLAKFQQNEHIKEYLLEYGDDVAFVECSPWDNYWGNGLSIDDTRNTPVIRWPGKNMLGKVLDNVKRFMTIS